MVLQPNAKRKAFQLNPRRERHYNIQKVQEQVLYLAFPHCFLCFVFLQVMFH